MWGRRKEGFTQSVGMVQYEGDVMWGVWGRRKEGCNLYRVSGTVRGLYRVWGSRKEGWYNMRVIHILLCPSVRPWYSMMVIQSWVWGGVKRCVSALLLVDGVPAPLSRPRHLLHFLTSPSYTLTSDQNISQIFQKYLQIATNCYALTSDQNNS